ARGMLAAAAPVAAFGVLRDTCAPAELLKVVVAAGLDARIYASSQKPSADRAQRRRQAMGAEEPEPPVRARRVDGNLPRRPGDPDASAGRDDQGVDVLAGAAHHGRLVDEVRRQPNRFGCNGNLVT